MKDEKQEVGADRVPVHDTCFDVIGFREEEVSDVAGAGMEEEVEVAQLVLLLLQSRTPWRRIEGDKGGLGKLGKCVLFESESEGDCAERRWVDWHTVEANFAVVVAA